MAKPVIWTVDDDADVLRVVERDLRRHYGDRYKVISADSGVSALDATKQLKLRNEPVALFLVDQRMRRMSGVEFLEKAIELYPEAKRALLTAYADTDAAIRAINNVHIDHYLMKPWDPPEERLYGVIDDLLDDWQASYHPAFQRVRVIGHQWSPHSTEIRDFLGRNFVPHQWLNVETEEDAKQVLKTTGINCFRCGPISSTMPFTRSTAPEKSASAPAWKTINSSSKSWTTVQAFLGMPSGICSSLFSRPNPSAQAPALAASSAIASSATVMGAKSNLNPAPVKRALECGFPSTARNLPTPDHADPEVS